MNYRRYPAYKESGVEWLGDVPAHWDTCKLAWLFKRKKDTGHPDEELLSVYRDYGVIPKSSRDDNFNKPSDDLSTYQLVMVGDLVLNKMKTWQGSIAVSRYRGIVSPAYYVASPVGDFDIQYMHYLLRSDVYIAQYLRHSGGIRPNQWDLDYEQFRVIEALIPPLDEQAAIAAFLDCETAQIDALIAKQERLIAVLQEKRQALIAHAVTKGLNPAAPMKDSGVEWLGDVPAHWEVLSLGKVAKLQRGHDLPEPVRKEGSYPVITSSGPFGTHNESKASAPGVVTGRYGTIGQIYYVEQDYWPLNTSLYVVDFFNNHPRFIYYLLMILPFDMYSDKSAVPGVNRNHLHTLAVTRPPLAEQIALASYLDNALLQIDAGVERVKAGIALLRERRAALVSAAVTGKIDVRG